MKSGGVGGGGSSLVSQPYFSLFLVGGARGREKYVTLSYFSLPLTPPTRNKEKYGWFTRLGGAARVRACNSVKLETG